MPNIKFNESDFAFLTAQAKHEGISIEEYVSLMIDRQRIIVKHQGTSTQETSAAKPNLEPPHRKWGM